MNEYKNIFQYLNIVYGSAVTTDSIYRYRLVLSKLKSSILKYFFYLILIFLNVACQRNIEIGKRDSSQIIEKLEPGKCYESLAYKSLPDIKNTKHLLIEFNDVILTKELRTYRKQELQSIEISKIKNSFTIGKALKTEKGIVQIPYSPAHLKLRIQDLNEVEQYKNSKKEGYFFCYIEVPPKFRIIKLDTLQKEEIQFEIYSLKTEANIKRAILKKKPKMIKHNEKYFNNLAWTSEREFVAYHKDYPQTIISDIQNALRKKGYDIKITNEINIETKNAIIDFQKRNNLKVGRIDFETLKKLEVRR